MRWQSYKYSFYIFYVNSEILAAAYVFSRREEHRTRHTDATDDNTSDDSWRHLQLDYYSNELYNLQNFSPAVLNLDSLVIKYFFIL